MGSSMGGMMSMANKAAESAAAHSSTAKKAMDLAKSNTSGSEAGGKDAEFEARWHQEFGVDTDLKYGLGEFKLSGIEYVYGTAGSADAEKNFEEAVASGGDTLGGSLEMLIVDEAGDPRLWTMKFESERNRLMLASALLCAKDNYRPKKRSPKKKKGMLETARDKVKDVAGAAVFKAMEAGFEKAFSAFSGNSPWLRVVATGSIDEIKAFVEEKVRLDEIDDPTVLARRHPWAQSSLGCNAIHYACWYRDGHDVLPILHYLTDTIEIDVNIQGTMGTGLHPAVWKMNLVACKYLIFKSHASKHAPRKSILDETMKAGALGTDNWTVSDLLNIIWMSGSSLGVDKRSLPLVTEFLDREVEKLEASRDVFFDVNRATAKEKNGKTHGENLAEASMKQLQDFMQQQFQGMQEAMKEEVGKGLKAGIGDAVKGAVNDAVEHSGLGEAVKEIHHISETVDKIDKKIDNLSDKLDQTKDVLLRGILDANELTVPNCFVILPYKLVDLTDAERSFIDDQKDDFDYSNIAKIIKNQKVPNAKKFSIESIKKITAYCENIAAKEAWYVCVGIMSSERHIPNASLPHWFPLGQVRRSD